jgi:uncharacterized delta-60 repeat protein
VIILAALAAGFPARAGNAGDLDAAFDGDGWVVTDAGIGAIDRATGVAVQADGKIVVCGYGQAIDPDDSVIALLRYNADGSLDPTFGTGGRVLTSAGANSFAHSVLVQPDGAFVVGGYGGSTAVLLRYAPDGSLDPTFAGDGIAEIATPGGFLGEDLARQPDGKIVIVGSVSASPANDEVAVVRRNADGSADTSFDGDGLVVTSLGSGIDSASAVAIQPDGMLVVAGVAAGAVALLRYDAAGALDASFDGDGIATTAIGTSAAARDVALQGDGRIVVAARVQTGTAGGYDFGVLRYDADGSLDAGFDGDGRAVIGFTADSHDLAEAIAIQADGRIVLVGSTDFGIDAPYAPRVALVRYQADGSVDTAFDGDGKVSSDIGGSDLVRAVALQADGRIVVAASARRPVADDIAVLRYLSDGASICAAAPAPGCLTGTQSVVVLKAALDDRKDTLLWKTKNGPALSQMDLADPTLGTAYTLCVYAGTANTLIADAALPAGAAWRALGSTGYKFKGASADGLTKAGISGPAAKVQVKGRGGALPDPALPLEYPVTVQVTKAASPLCLQSTFTAADVKKNTVKQFKAKTP